MKKFLAIFLSVLFMLSVFAVSACSGQNNDDNNPPSSEVEKSILNVGVFSSWGTNWAEQAAFEFETLYADTSFEEGKKGVDVIFDWGIEKFQPTNLLTAMERYDNTLYYVIQHDYTSYLGSRLLSSMTEAVTDKVYDEDGNLAMMDDGKGNYIPIGNKPATLSMMDRVAYGADEYYLEYDNNYYAAPWGVNISGIIYDADLFSNKGYFFGADGKMGKTLEDVESGNCGTGPDYKMNTADDGMPVTYTDFIALLAKMESDGVTPFTWAGQTTYQRSRAFESIWANYEGAENFHLNFAVKDITDEQLSQAGVKKPYEYLALQQGRKAAIKFFYDIVENEYYTEKAFTQSGMQAGALYIKSIATDNPIAFCVGASNWENALSKEFGELVKETGNSNYEYGKRNFKIFPIPNFVDVEGIADQTNKDSREVLPGYYTDTLAFIANRPSCDNPTVQKHLAKLFLQFTSSRRQAVEFMSNTGGVMSMYKFTIEEHETSLLTKYGQDICRYIKEGAVIVPYTEYASERKAKLTFNPFILTGDNIQKYYYDPATAFKENPNLTVEECFKKVQTGVRSLF